MHRKTPIAQLLYSYLFPHPTQSDPPSFSAISLAIWSQKCAWKLRCSMENLNSAEARYPGLNYCHPPHRMRLGRFKHHRRLFDAFDNLKLTYREIQDFCCWEGTRWARERYEKDEGGEEPSAAGVSIAEGAARVFSRTRSRGAFDARRNSRFDRRDPTTPVHDEDEEMGNHSRVFRNPSCHSQSDCKAPTPSLQQARLPLRRRRLRTFDKIPLYRSGQRLHPQLLA
ncbi:hypothetical protein MRB53_040308 [Persea americana]|nr:hypothetical protein MRB53_040308 [Persea americana]